MVQPSMAVLGIGATGTVLAAALLAENKDVVLVGRNSEAGERILRDGISVTGAFSGSAKVTSFYTSLLDVPEPLPEVIFIATKTFSLNSVLDDVARIWRPGMVLVSTHNGLGPEDLIADRFGPQAAFRMSLNYGTALKGPGSAEVAFFNRPNPLGCLDPSNRELGKNLAATLTRAGLDTELVDDIKLFIWKKMIMKCTMASICAVTDRTIKGALDFPPTREIADNCFREILAVAKGKGYDLGADYMKQAMGYLEKVGAHKDSMCADVAAKRPTEIDFLGGKVVEYATQLGISAPYYRVMTNLVKSLEESYLSA